MPRPPANHPTYYASRGGYFIRRGGLQVLLSRGPDDAPDGPTYRAALAEMLRVEEPAPADTVAGVLADYLNSLEGRSSFRQAAHAIRLFSATFGTRPAGGVAVKEAEEWLRSHPAWGQSYRQYIRAKVLAAFNLAVRNGVTPANPLQHWTPEMVLSRGKESLVSPADHTALLAWCDRRNRPFGTLLRALHATPCRPGEMCRVTASELREMGGVWYFDLTRWKTEKHGGARLILLPPAIAETARELATRHPAGPIFRNRYGKPWTPGLVVDNFWRLRDRLGLNPRLTAYSYRHTFATDWLRSGRSLAILSALIGSSVKTIMRHYSHLIADVRGLGEQLNSFTAGR